MSAEKAKENAKRWFRQGRTDLNAALGSISAGSYEWACFQSQQAAEKALKAFWHHNNVEPWGHSIVRLIQDYPNEPEHTRLLSLLPNAKHLDKL